MSSLFKSTKQELPGAREVTAETQKTAQERLKAFGDFGGAVTPYSDLYGDLPYVAADEPYEATIPGLLEAFTGREAPGVTTAGIQQIMDTLTGGYDPATSPYYKSLRRGVEKEREAGQTRLRQVSQAAGQFRGTGRLGLEREREEETFATLADIMAGLTEAERVRKLDVLPLAFAAGQEEEAFPLRSLAALQQFSLWPRKQAALETERGDIARGREEQISIAQYLADPSAYTFNQPQYQTTDSSFDRILMPLIQAMATGSSGTDFSKFFKTSDTKRYKDPIGTYDVGYGAGYYPGGYAPS